MRAVDWRAAPQSGPKPTAAWQPLAVRAGPRHRLAVADNYARGWARDFVFIIIEVADTRYAKDRQLKLPLDATAGIPEVWIVTLLERRIEVYRRPVTGQYSDVRFVGEGEVVAPAAFPTVVVAVTAVMPAQE